MCQPFFEPKIVWPLVMMAESSVKLQAMLGTLRCIDELAPRPAGRRTRGRTAGDLGDSGSLKSFDCESCKCEIVGSEHKC